VVTHRNRRPPVAHWRRTVAASRRIIGAEFRIGFRKKAATEKTAAELKVAAATAENST
jgi:hypothetical protein